MKTSYYNRLETACQSKQTHLCIGLDFDLDKMINKSVCCGHLTFREKSD